MALYLASQSSLSRNGMQMDHPGPVLLDRTKNELQGPGTDDGSCEADVEDNRITVGEGGSVPEQAGQGGRVGKTTARELRQRAEEPPETWPAPI